MSQVHITTQDDVPAPDGDEPYDTFVNQSEHGCCRFLRTNVLSPRPDLKKYIFLRFQQDVMLVFMEAVEVKPPLCLAYSEIHLKMEGYPVEQGSAIEIPLLPQAAGGLPRLDRRN